MKHAIKAAEKAVDTIQEIGKAIGKAADDILKATGEAFSAEDKKQLETVLKDRLSGELSDEEIAACLNSGQCTYETEHGTKELSTKVAGLLQRGEGNFLNDLNVLTGDGYSNKRLNAAGAQGRPVGSYGRAVIDRNIEIFWKSYIYADSIGDEALKRDLIYEIGQVLGGQNYLYSDAGPSDASRIYAALPVQYKSDLLSGFAGGFEQAHADTWIAGTLGSGAASFGSLTVLLNRKAPGAGTRIQREVANKGQNSYNQAANSGFVIPPTREIPTWHGSGPRGGVIGLNSESKSNGVLRNFNPNEGVEFVFDPSTSTFLVRAPSSPVKHSILADSIGAPRDQVVGGILTRGPDGKFLTNEASGHFHQNWTPELRTQFTETMRRYGLEFDHRVGM